MLKTLQTVTVTSTEVQQTVPYHFDATDLSSLDLDKNGKIKKWSIKLDYVDLINITPKKIE